MATVNKFKGTVVNRLQTELEPEVGAICQFSEHLQNVIRDAVRSGGNYQAGNIRYDQGLIKQLTQAFGMGVGI